MGNTFNANNVSRRAYQAFPEAEYVLELDTAKVTEASTGTWQVALVWRIRGERYNNLTVFDHLYVTEESFPVTINKLLDMGIQQPDINSTSAKTVATKVAALMPKGMKCQARVYEVPRYGGGGYVRNVRGYLPLAV